MRRSFVVAAVTVLGCGTPGTPGGRGRADVPRVIEPPTIVTRAVPSAPAALGDEVAPVAARLALDLDPSARSYRGSIELDLQVARPIDAIWFHASPELVLTAPRVTRAGAEVAIDPIVAAVGVGIAGVPLRVTLAPGPATLRLEFAAPYRERDALFRQDVDGVPFVFSDFEPVDARRAFPGFDLPHWRIPYTVTIRTPEGQDAYANMPLAQETREGDWIARRFEPTPPLPTYLVAFAAGRFTIVDVPDAPIPSRFLVPRKDADVSLGVSLLGPILDRARTVIARPIPWPKLDIVLVPLLPGAMENPGLVTIGADLAIAPPSADLRRLLAMILAHEVAHLWFGDLVTLASWRELWLNEGLASWMADQTLAALTPSWREPIDRVDERLQVYEQDDHPGATHALRPADVANPRALFDRLSYDKGAAVVHMLDAWLGPDRVRAALAGWLDRHAWSHATSEDLIAALAPIDPQLPIARVMQAALAKTGVPAVAADVACEPAGARLDLRGPRDHPLVVCARWGGAAAGRACAVVEETATIALGAACPAWVLPDAGAVGYYRWQLAPRWWAALAAAPPAGAELRVAVEQVIEGLAAGHARPADAFAILAAAVASGEHRLIEAAARWLPILAAAASDRDRAALTKRIRAATDRALRRLGRTPAAGDDPDRTRARLASLELAGVLGADPKVVRWADGRVDAWLRGKPARDAELAVALEVTGHRGSARRKAAIVEAARRQVDRPRALDRALGRAAAAAAPGDAALALLDPPATGQRPRAVEGVLAALLEDPRRADAAVARLQGRDTFLAFLATPVPCATPPAPPAAALDDATTQLRLIAARLAPAVARCRAVAGRLAAPPP